MRPASSDAGGGSHGKRSATAVAMPPASVADPEQGEDGAPAHPALSLDESSLSSSTRNRERALHPLCTRTPPLTANERETTMGLGVGIFLAAVGAVLAFAVTDTVSGVNIHTVGWILLIVGIIGIVLSMIFWSSWAGPGYFGTPPPHDVRRRGPRRLPATRPSERLLHDGAASGRP